MCIGSGTAKRRAALFDHPSIGCALSQRSPFDHSSAEGRVGTEEAGQKGTFANSQCTLSMLMFFETNRARRTFASRVICFVGVGSSKSDGILKKGWRFPVQSFKSDSILDKLAILSKGIESNFVPTTPLLASEDLVESF